MKNQDGSVLVLSLIFMLVLVILIGAMAISFNNEISLSSNEHKMVQAQYYAESCLEYASYFLGTGGYGEENIWDSGEFNKKDYLEDILDDLNIISITKQELGGDKYKLTCNINYQGVSESLAAFYHVEEYVDDCYKKAITTKGDIYFNGEEKGEVNGDIYTNGKMEDVKNADPEESEMEFDGDIAEEQEDNIIPDYSYYFENDFEDLEFDQNNANILEFESEVKEVNGNAIFGNRLTTKGLGILVVNGEMTVRDQAKINVDSDDFFIIICKGNVVFEDTVEGNFLLYSGGQVQFHDKVDINGTIIAENAEHINDHYYHEHDNSYLDTFRKLGVPIPTADPSKSGTYDIQITDWQEFID